MQCARPLPKALEKFVILAIRRGEKVRPMYTGLSLEVDDVAAVAIHTEERESAAEVLTAWGWAPERAAASPS